MKKTRRRLNRTERESTLMEAAAKIVTEQGVAALTMEGLADQTGVNKALVYRFFANRDAVLLALWDRETAEFDSQVEASLDGTDDLAARLGALVGRS